MSGALSIPFGILGALTERDYQRYSWWALAFVAVVVSYYIDHKKLAARVQELEDRIKPRLKLSFAADKTKKIEGATYTYLRASNESDKNIDGALTKIIESKVKKEGSDSWEKHRHYSQS
jgi:hypothetical protein